MKVVMVTLLALSSIYFRKVNLSGGIAGAIVTYCILANSWVNFILFGLFFVLGSVATKWQFEQKKTLGLSQENEGTRTWIHATANGGVAALCSLFALLLPSYATVLTFATTATIAAALSDTLSSELGNIYGKNYYNILNFQKGKRGEDGIVSWEGTAFGGVGSCFVALVFGGVTGHDTVILPIAIAGWLGNLCDSYLGATLQRQGWLNNHQVNFLNTLFAAFLLILWFLL